jgi:hypothetical protein
MKIHPDSANENFIQMLESLGGMEALEKMARAMMKDPRIQEMYEEALKENPDMDKIGPETLFEFMKGMNK